VDAIGPGVTGFTLGQRVAALTVYGGFGELLVRDAEHFLTIPAQVSDAQAAAVVLNYVTAWQMIHRVAKVRSGETASEKARCLNVYSTMAKNPAQGERTPQSAQSLP